MSYRKATELMDLALEIGARRWGMALADIDGRWGLKDAASARRRTQRALAALCDLFPGALEEVWREGRKVVRFTGKAIGSLPATGPADLAALTEAALVLRRHGGADAAARLERLRAALGLAHAARRRGDVDTGVDALLSARFMVVRPGPRPAADPAVLGPIADALADGVRLAFDYAAPGAAPVRRTVDPFGLLLGPRTHLVARPTHRGEGDPSRWRVDRMAGVEPLAEPARVPEDFSLPAYAARAFGGFYREEEYGEVVWRFSPAAAAHAATFVFHPEQTLEREADGSLLVSFRAAGHLEMAWFLYQWGDAVEVIAPEALRVLVEGHRRGDFPALP